MTSRGDAIEIMYADSFDRVNNLTLGETDQVINKGTNPLTGSGIEARRSAPWIPVTGVAGITSGQAYAVSLSGDMVTVLETQETDHWVRVSITAIGSGNVGVVARFVDNGNHYLAQVNTSAQLQLFRKVAGSYTQIGSGATGFAAGAEMGLRVTGSRIRMYVDDTLIYDVTDTNIALGTKAGIRIDTAGAGNVAGYFYVTKP